MVPLAIAESPTVEEVGRLTALVRETAASGTKRRALMLRLSLLPPQISRPHHLALMRHALDPLAGADHARSFRLPNRDMVVIWREAASPALAETLRALELLFADAPVDLDLGEIILVLDLPDAADRLLGIVARSVSPPRLTVTARAPRPNPLDLTNLARLEGAIVRADLEAFARRKPICREESGVMRLAWEKRYISVHDLVTAMIPDRDTVAAPWLFRRLALALDRRLLALLSVSGALDRAPDFAINLGVSSLLSAEFMRFDTRLPAELRGRVTIDLHPSDIVSDPEAFLFARSFARIRGYRLALRCPTLTHIAAFPSARTHVDFVQVRYSPELAAAGPFPINLDPGRIVLTRVATEAALMWGRRHGIRLFQGSLVRPIEPRTA